MKNKYQYTIYYFVLVAIATWAVFNNEITVGDYMIVLSILGLGIYLVK